MVMSKGIIHTLLESHARSFVVIVYLADSKVYRMRR